MTLPVRNGQQYLKYHLTNSKEPNMKKWRASSTARDIALFRSFESMKPENERMCYDPFAKNFLDKFYRLIIKNKILTKIAISFFDRNFPNTHGTIAIRVRFIDDYLKTCIDNKIEQLVIMGAGFDTRAYRLNELNEKIKIFEIDHPATQKTKKEKIRNIFGTIPSNVIYVPVDFNNEKPGKRLIESGYYRNLKTLFIWEGVTMYLEPSAVDETLSFVVNNSGKGSSIIFDYLFKSIVDGTDEHYLAKRLRRLVKLKGEPYLFGIEEGVVANFLHDRGFYQVKDITWEVLESTYSKVIHQKINTYPFWRLVHATVDLQKIQAAP